MRAIDATMLRCTACGHVSLERQGQNLACPACHTMTPVVEDIPRFVPAENYGSSFGLQWNRHRRTQLDSFTGLSLTRDRLFAATRWPTRLDGLRVLEAGSGAGRFTEILVSTGAEVHSFDLSAAVDANRQNNGAAPNLTLYQADILNPPFPPASFDKVICLGVIQHTPDPGASFQSLARFVKPGGEIVIDCYPKTLAGLLNWKYVLRPITTRMDRETLYRVIERWAPRLVPASAWLRRHLGRGGMRLLPILQYEHWGLPDPLNREWAVLDTFDMYSPTYDNPATASEIREWLEKAGLNSIDVRPGLNGFVASGRRPTHM
ncbi:MAG: methyltransferase domain-containing protein [Sphingomonadaceae bacterium]